MTTNEKTVREPLFHVVKRNNMSVLKRVLIYAIAIVTALLITGIFCAITNKKGKGLFDMFRSVFVGAFNTKSERWRFLRDTALLLGVSLALVPAFKMKFWNCGAEGQVSQQSEKKATSAASQHLLILERQEEVPPVPN